MTWGQVYVFVSRYFWRKLDNIILRGNQYVQAPSVVIKDSSPQLTLIDTDTSANASFRTDDKGSVYIFADDNDDEADSIILFAIDGTMVAKLMDTGAFCIRDGLAAPSAESGWAFIYVDTADGDLKVKFGDGTTKTIATDT